MRSPVLLSALAAAHVAAWRTEGELPTTSSFATYIGKFCFDYVSQLPDDKDQSLSKPTSGVFEFEVAGHVKARPADLDAEKPVNRFGKLYFVVYDDERDHWRRVRPFWDELTCEERLELASWSTTVKGLGSPGSTSTDKILVHQHIRPRFWYFAFVNCGAEILEPVTFSVHALNTKQGFQEEFGMDVRGSLLLEVAGLVFFSLIVVAMGVIALTRTARLRGRGLPPLLRLLGLSAACSALGAGFRALHHWIFAYDGRGVLSAAVLGTFFAGAAKATLTVLQFLIAKGWAMLFTPDERAHRNTIVVALAMVISISVCCEGWEQYFHDQSTAFYLYESWTGRSMLVMNNTLLVVASVLMYNTHQRESHPEVRSFYRVVGASCGIYVLSLSVVCVLAELLDPWVRRKYVERTELGTRFGCTVMLLLALRPSHIDRLISARLKNGQQPELLQVEANLDEEG